MKIIFCNELPQWIISSDIGAYHPIENIIYIRKNLGIIKTIKVLVHELRHFIIYKLNLPESWHKEIQI